MLWLCSHMRSRWWVPTERLGETALSIFRRLMADGRAGGRVILYLMMPRLKPCYDREYQQSAHFFFCRVDETGYSSRRLA